MKPLSLHKLLATAAFLVILFVFNVLSLAIPFERNSGFWLSYGFSTLALALTATGSFHALGGTSPRSRFLRLPVLYVVWIYGGLQIVSGWILAALPAPLWLHLLSGSVLLGVGLVGLMAVEISVAEIERIDRKAKEKVFRIQSLQTQTETMTGKTTDPALQKSLQKLADTLRYSDPVSHRQLAELENEVERQTTLLDRELDAGNTPAAQRICEELLQLLAERNRKCRLHK
ncbi:MAG: hypothetical protein LBD89_08660 [Tannerellaceae bacterium]|jgi:hypothetical protein|nr:hypothetical protein [Tannerellaceae bacterium]